MLSQGNINVCRWVLIESCDTLNEVGDTTKVVMQAFVVGNFALNIALSSSLSALWGMLNAL